MRNVTKKDPAKPDVPKDIQAHWQRIVDLLARIVDVRAALIWRVDPPQTEVFVASNTVGNPYSTGDRKNMNAGRYCDAVMDRKTPLLVPDARKDTEWDHNPALSLGMTYYLGYPLLWPDGDIFGTICVLDIRDNTQATEFTGLVREFQQIVERDLRLIMQVLERESWLAETQILAGIGSWEWDIIHDTHHWSSGLCRIFGLPPEANITYEGMLASVHPDDRQRVHEANIASISSPGKPYSAEYRVVHPDGTEHIIHARAEVLFDQNDKPVRMIGTAQDITERKQAQEALEKAYNEIAALKDQLQAENVYLHEDVDLLQGYGDIIGQSNPVRYTLHRARQVARTKTTILLTGETGTGKGMFAHFIHRESDRRDKPFVNVNCAGLPANLIESELFGREKGAFTGSTARQIGRFELADRGTIFLDEIGELPLELQAKLLKVIEDEAFERLGSPHTVKVDVRIIASTNRNLDEEIKKGAFRQDLFFRLNVFPITIPPLRQRGDDVLLLAKAFVAKFSKNYDKPIERIPSRIMESFRNYTWPGNVRELINVMERAVIVSDGPELQLAEKIDALSAIPVRLDGPSSNKVPENKALAEAEKEHILKVLEQTGWRVEGARGAAELLELHPNTLRSRMKKLGIKRPGK